MSETTTSPSQDERIEAALVGMSVSLHARCAPERSAIISGLGDRTFAELNSNANRLVRALRARGLGEGDSMSFICANRPEFVEIYAAALRMGIRATPVNWHLTADEIAYIVADSDAKAIVGDARFGPEVAKAAVQTPRAAIRLSIAGEIDGFEPYDAALESESGTDIDDPTLGRTMLYTSGTTGRPKGVDRPSTETRPGSRGSRPLVAEVAAASRYDPARHRALCTGPLYHAAPLAFSLTGPLAAGVSTVVMDGWDPEETLRLVEEHRITHTHMVPTMFHRLLSLPEEVRERFDVSTLRFVVHGAAPCPVPTKLAFIEWLGPVVYEYYAATEGGGTFVGPAEWLERPGTVGKPADDDLVRIESDDGDQLDPDEVGTVYLRAPDTGRFRYHGDDDETSRSYRGDYFTLGDHGYLDADGYLYLTGRSAELIISGGVNIYPAEVDAVFLTHPAVGDVGTIGVPDEEWGEQVLAVVELQPGWEPGHELAEKLVDYCRERLARYKCPRRVEFVDSLPRQDNGKLYRRRLREAFVGEDDPTGHRSAEAQEVNDR